MMSDILLTLMQKVELGELTKEDAVNLTLDEILELCVEQFFRSVEWGKMECG